MAEDNPETPQPGEQTLPSDDILQSVGLSREDYEGAKADEQAEAQRKAELFQKGRQYYPQAHTMFWSGMGGTAEIDLGYYQFRPNIEGQKSVKPEDIADVTKSMLPDIKKSNPQIADKIEGDIAVFLGGYVEGALETKTSSVSISVDRFKTQRWQIAINTIDVITEGGVMANKDFLARTKEVTGGDNPNGDQISERSKIAEMLQTRVSKTKNAQIISGTTELKSTPPPKGDPRLN